MKSGFGKGMVKVKICGITRLEDALVALEAGADYLGFILYSPSPRAIAPNALATLTAELKINHRTRASFDQPVPPILVGVFVNELAGRAAQILDDCGLDLAQLSGDEDPLQFTDPASPLYRRAYKAIRPRSLAESFELSSRYTNFFALGRANQPHLLLDTPHGRLYGGTGMTGDWSIAGKLAATTPGLMLAGGLTPDNVSQAVHQARPFAVDVASGVEAGPGHKDHARIRAFIANAKSVN